MRLLIILSLLIVSVAFATDKITNVQITHPETIAQIRSVLNDNGDKSNFGRSFMNYFRGLLTGARPASVLVSYKENDAVKATGYFTLSGVTTAADTFTIGDATLTAVAVGSTPSKDEYAVGATETATSANMTAAINLAANSFDDYVTAVNTTSLIVTLSAAQAGVIGNAIQISESGTNATASAAHLSGGTDDTNSVSSATFGYGK